MLKYWLHLSSVEDLIFLLGIATAVALLRSRYDYIDGNPIPVVIFKNKPALFHAFLVPLNFGFTAALGAMSLRGNTPTLARLFRSSALACAVVAAGLLFYSALLPS